MDAGVQAMIDTVIYHWRVPVDVEPGASDFMVQVQVLIGDNTNDRADSFDFIVCSPNRLADLYAPEAWDSDSIAEASVLPGGNVLPLTGVWLMRAWSPTDLEASLERLVKSVSPAPTFGVAASRISRVIPWEYDFRFDAQQNEDAGLPASSAYFWDVDR